jgi:hypothetical protein
MAITGIALSVSPPSAHSMHSQETSHHENKTRSYRSWGIGAHNKRGQCRTPYKASHERLVFVACVRAKLWLRFAIKGKLSFAAWSLRIPFAGEAIVPKSGPRAVSDPPQLGIFLVKVITGATQKPGESSGLTSVS